jgi:hypothetical protein
VHKNARSVFQLTLCEELAIMFRFELSVVSSIRGYVDI